jgi:hypothetical protein
MSRQPEDKRRYNKTTRKLKDQIKRIKEKTFQLTPTIHSGKQANE